MTSTLRDLAARSHGVRQAVDAAFLGQGRIRDLLGAPTPSRRRSADIAARLREGLSQPRPRIAVASVRAKRLTSAASSAELAQAFAGDGLAVSFHDDLDDAGIWQSDLVILLLHANGEDTVIRKARRSGCRVPVVGWTWDNHHGALSNRRAAVSVDVLHPGHAFAKGYLRSRAALMGCHVPLCTAQWALTEAVEGFARTGFGQRSNELYGGFFGYRLARRRNRLVEELRAAGMQHVGLLDSAASDAYHALSADERFSAWTAHKASLCAPVKGDLSLRLFDSLVTGGIPIIAPDVRDLDSVIPPELQRELPVIRLAEYSTDAARRALEQACRAFDEGGTRAMERRHRFVLENHMLEHRIRSIIQAARDLASLADRR